MAKENTEMSAVKIPEVIETVVCDLSGFQGVEVDVNVMANSDQLDGLSRILRSGEEQNVIKDIRHWPSDLYGSEPFGASSPVVFNAWVAQQCVSQALAQYINDPN